MFDLDETLIHCNESCNMPSDVVLNIKFPTGESVDAGINVRYFAQQILQELSKICEVIVFTASHECYANKVLNYLDPENQWIHHRLFRNNCVQSPEGVHIKDLRVFADRNLKDLVLVDNAAYSYGFQLSNGIPIIPFYNNKNDKELAHLLEYLMVLLKQNDMRVMNKKIFQSHVIMESHTVEIAVDKLFS